MKRAQARARRLEGCQCTTVEQARKVEHHLPAGDRARMRELSGHRANDVVGDREQQQPRVERVVRPTNAAEHRGRDTRLLQRERHSPSHRAGADDSDRLRPVERRRSSRSSGFPSVRAHARTPYAEGGTLGSVPPSVRHGAGPITGVSSVPDPTSGSPSPGRAARAGSAPCAAVPGRSASAGRRAPGGGTPPSVRRHSGRSGSRAARR